MHKEALKNFEEVYRIEKVIYKGDDQKNEWIKQKPEVLLTLYSIAQQHYLLGNYQISLEFYNRELGKKDKYLKKQSAILASFDEVDFRAKKCLKVLFGTFS